MDIETRRRNAEARKQLRAAQYAERRQDEALVVAALRAVLQDPEASASERLFAVIVLDKVRGYYFVPHDMRNDAAIIADFAKRLEAAQQKDTK